MTALLLALVLSQTAPTRAEVIGALNTLEDGVIAVANANPNVTVVNNAAKTRACIRATTGIPAGSKIVRFGVTIISPRIQYELGLTIPPGTPTTDPNTGATLTIAQRWALAGERYAGIEVQAVPTEDVTFDVARMNEHLDVIREEIEIRATPVNATCNVGVIRFDDTTLADAFRCACAQTPATCTWTRPNANGTTTNVTPAPTGVTFGPGAFSGAGCRRKPCVTRFDGPGIDNSWPTECPK
jgi:hypothetical protein